MDHPIILAQFTAASPWAAWVSYGAGIWYTDLSGAYPLVDSELVTGIAIKDLESNIGTVIYDGDELPKAESLTELLSAPSYYWVSTTRTLYAHFPMFNPPNATVSIGILYSVAQEFFDGLDGTIFLPHLKDLPPLSQEKDRIFFKKIALNSWTMTLNNSGLTYDGLPDWGVYNRIVQYYLGEAGQPFSEFVPIRSGRIRDFAFRGSEVIVNVQDLRAQLTLRAPTTSLTVAEYPNLDTKLSGKKKPIAFGRLFDVEPACLNATDPTGPYVFLLADPVYGSLKAVDDVRVDGADVVPSAIDLEACTVTLTAGQVLDGSQFRSVRVDFQGYSDAEGDLIENPLDIIAWLLANVAGVEYNSTNYSQLEWEREKLEKPSVALLLSSPIQILSVIESMMEATRGGFLVTPDGRFTWRTPNYAARPKWNITDLDWIEMPEVTYDTSEVLASVRVGYRRSQAEGSYRYVETTTRAATVYRDFRILDDEDFDLPLVDAEDAETFGSDVMALSGEPAIIVNGRVPIDFAGMQIGQNAQVALNRYVGGSFQTWLGVLQGEILGVAPDAASGEVEITVRIVRGIPEYLATTGTGAIYGACVYGATSYGEA